MPPIPSEQQFPDDGPSSQFDRLEQEVHFLSLAWKCHRQLYGAGKETIDLLNACAPTFFHLTQHSQLAGAVTTICRITDPKKTSGKDNLVLAQLENEPGARGLPDAADKMGAELADLKKLSQPLRDRRNQIISHLDYKQALGVADEPVPGLSRQMISDCLESVWRCMNVYRVALGMPTAAYEHLISRSDGNTLLQSLKQAELFKRLRREGLVDRDGNLR